MQLIIEQGLSFWFGVFLMFTSLSVLLHPSQWVRLMVGHSVPLTTLCLISGGINISLGPFILGFHWNWEGWSMVLTLVGLLATIKGALLLLLPEFCGQKIQKFFLEDKDSLTMKLRIAGIVPLLLSLAILFNWWCP